MAKKYSEVEELGEIRDRLIEERDAARREVKSLADANKGTALSLVIEGNELLSRLQRLKARIAGLGYEVPQWTI